MGAFGQLTTQRKITASASLDPNDEATLLAKTEALMEARLASVTKVAPAFSATLLCCSNIWPRGVFAGGHLPAVRSTVHWCSDWATSAARA
ncbi:MAG: hypothetical protein C0449_07295 [Polaromonas sp.]|nr:hypothetical protein [Polaromonas sp.]